MKCIIFGGGGFIGSAIVDRLLRDGHSLRIFERPGIVPFREFAATEQVEWVHGDFLSMADVSDAVAGMDAVLHLVSTTLPKSSNDDPVYDVSTNVIGSLHVLNAMVAHGVRKIVFISSGGTVYGVPREVPVTETHPTDPTSSYGITKLTVEKYLHLYQHLHGLTPVILRVANPYGERQSLKNGQGAIGLFLHAALTDRPIEIWGDGSTVRDYIYIADVAEAFAKAAVYDGPMTVFNIGAGYGVSLNQLIEHLQTALDKPLIVTYKPARAFDVPASVLDIQRARTELGWEPTTALGHGLGRTAQWLRSVL